MTEELILVDVNNKVVGYDEKIACHTIRPHLHRAFSIFLFRHDGSVLLQRRSEKKLLWPLFWSNACCSHPRKGESTIERATIRLQEELGITSPLRSLYSFVYRAEYLDVGVEEEHCEVFIGHLEDGYSVDSESINKEEVAQILFVSPAELTEWIQREPGALTPWSKLEWAYIANKQLP
jgi:isopentenyl-diphosphate delta-isomerase